MKIRSLITFGLLISLALAGCTKKDDDSSIASASNTSPSISTTTPIPSSDVSSSDVSSSEVPLVYYTVNFYVDEDIYATLEIEENQKATKPEVDPYLNRHTFQGWFTISGMVAGTPFDFDSLITADLNLYAGFIPNETIKVLFNGMMNAVPVMAYEGEEFRPDGYGNEYYDFTNFYTFLIEEYEGFDQFDVLQYEDIKTHPDVEVSEEYDFTLYTYNSGVIKTQICYYDENFQLVLVDALDYYLEIYEFFDSSITFFSDGDNELLFFTADSQTEVFKLIDLIELGESLHYDDIEKIAHNGLAIVIAMEFEESDDYIRVGIYDDEDSQDVYLRAGDTIDLSFFEAKGEIDYVSYTKFTPVDVTIEIDYDAELEAVIRDLCEQNEHGYFELDENYNVTQTDVKYMLSFSGDGDYLLIIKDGSTKHYVYFRDFVPVANDVNGPTYYNVIYHGSLDDYTVYVHEDDIMTEYVVTQEIFDSYSDLDFPLELEVIYK